MGVTISCTKTGRTIDMGSGGFLRLRSKISELVGEPWTSHYKALVEERICDEKEREKFYEDFDKKTEELLNKKCVSVKLSISVCNRTVKVRFAMEPAKSY